MSSVLQFGGAAAVSAAEPPSSMIERVTLILDLFVERPGQRFMLEEVSRRTGLPRSSAHRILEQMVQLRWACRSAAGYGLGSRVPGMGDVAGATALRAAAAPHLHELAFATGMVAHLAVLDGPDVVYLDRVGGRSTADVPSRVGGRALAHCTALGKAMLAWLSPDQVEATIGGRLDTPTRQSIGDPQNLHRELHRIRVRKGVTFERGECFPHIGCVSVGIRGSNGSMAAMSLVGEVDSSLERVAPPLVAAARAVSHELFGPMIGRWGDLAHVESERRRTWQGCRRF
ncbi:IclR family transcriptional regulator [Pseudonocardia xishanensis]|uniref:IclR family transcriptional regulator n=1 Tax=Pseudonocardia xishanensis TaxID=630995 RepID=A0ABP8RQL9_9PSEU